jgi:prepilin-type N-terminal cleavage/methylation domain-containing protein
MHRFHLQQRARRHGFTLVELMVTIVILGLMAGIVSISWERLLPGESLKSAVRVLSSRIHEARTEAIARSMDFRIMYDLENHAYWLQLPYSEEGRYEPNHEDRRNVYYTELPKDLRFDSITIDGVEYSGGPDPVFVRFDPLGASNAHTIVLYQTNRDRYHTIEVLGLTGAIRFHEGFFEREPPEDRDFD